MIVISNYKRDFIFHNLSNLKKYNKSNEKILVVDNQSSNCSDIIGFMNKEGIDGTAVLGDKNWEWSSWWKAYDLYPDEEKYIFIHDSMFLTADISMFYDGLDNNSVCIFDTRRAGWWSSKYPIRKCDLSLRFLSFFNYHKQDFHLVFGSMFCCKNKILKDMKQRGLMNFDAKDRTEAEAAERLLGIYFKKYDINLNIIDSKKKAVSFSGYKPFNPNGKYFVKFRPTRNA